MPPFSLDEYRAFSEAFDETIYDDLKPDASVNSKKTAGSCSFKSVEEQIARAKAAR